MNQMRALIVNAHEPIKVLFDARLLGTTMTDARK